MIQYIAGAAGAGLVVGGVLAAWLTWSYQDAVWSAATNELKVEAAASLHAATERVGKLNQEAHTRIRELETQHEQKEKDLAGVERRNRELAAQLGGLRDPGRRSSRPDAVSAAPAVAGCPEDAASAGYLSAEASAVLLNAAAEVDALAEYARLYFEWGEEARRILTPEE